MGFFKSVRLSLLVISIVYSIHHQVKHVISGELRTAAVFCVSGLLLMFWEEILEKTSSFRHSPVENVFCAE
jgi:hypothetical protein